MWLENQSKIGLIQPFSRVELPPLTLITGLNGSGKSQLLRGIAMGQIRSPSSPSANTGGLLSAPSDVVLLTNTDPDPEGLTATRNTDLATILEAPVRATEAVEIVRGALHQQAKERQALDRLFTESSGKTLADHGVDWSELVDRPTFALPPQLLGAPNFEEIMREAQPAERRIQAALQRHLQANYLGLGYLSMQSSEEAPFHFLAWSRNQFAAAVGWTEASLFTADLTSIFLQYRNKRWRNQVQRQTDEDEGTSLAFSREEFEKTYGKPPWERFTAALHSFGLPYSVCPVPYHPAQGVSFRLTRQGAAEPLAYSDLSSGERVLLRMMLASFQADDERLNIRSPKLILLDELDASLHPENVQRWLTAIQEGYVNALGCACILTTHSPTTVALAPEGSVFEMRADDPRPLPITKQHAIDRLTAGLPMLAIDYSARRQIFTESTIDVEHYSMLHDLMRPRLDMDRTLSFVGTSTRGSCNFVYDMVAHMVENGNRAVFGIVDWDLSNRPSMHVKVLADGTHYAKDNVLLDPLLVGALLLKGDDLPLNPAVRYTDLRNAAPELLQRVSDAVVDKVVFSAAASRARATNQYWGGLELSVREAYQRRQGHELEQAIKSAFPMLEGRYRAEGELASEIIRRVLGDLPEFCPKPISDLLTALANDQP